VVVSQVDRPVVWRCSCYALRDEGRLALTDPLDVHLPGTAVGWATVGALLAHTAGLVAEPPGPAGWRAAYT
jgi:CubicO group peptidase (beta-lactamase class C family)